MTPQNQWKRIGRKKRAGVNVPLFSLYSNNSIGIGELADLELLVDWCKATAMSIIQLLPMNDVGFDFRPYDAQSSFALEPMYLSLQSLTEVNARPFHAEIESLRKNFPAGGRRINYGIKEAKLKLLREIYQRTRQNTSSQFQRFIEQNQFWLKDYALFKVIKEKNQQKYWGNWGEGLKQKQRQALQAIEKESAEAIRFYQWLQWQLFEQFKAVKEYTNKKGILLMGDLPFLASRDSADVWAHQDYFKLDHCAGAPPDLYVADGQRWGMPPYHWDRIAANQYDYPIEKLKYAENFYDLLRIDHIIGIFRIWTIPLTEPLVRGGLGGRFDPHEETLWEGHGRKLLSMMVENTKMLICGEDLGSVPACSYKVLNEFAIPGMDVQRWNRDWGNSYDFKSADEYREDSIAVISTHDMSLLNAWWEYEAGTVDGAFFRRKCQEKKIPFDQVKEKLFDGQKSRYGRLRWKKEITDVRTLAGILQRSELEIADLMDAYRSSYDEKGKFYNYIGLLGEPQEKSSSTFIQKALEKVHSTASIFSIQLLQDWLSLDVFFKDDAWDYRINFPGTLSDKNWSVVMPLSLEQMQRLPINQQIQLMNTRAGRTICDKIVTSSNISSTFMGEG